MTSERFDMKHIKTLRTLAILGSLLAAGVYTTGCATEEALIKRIHVDPSASLRSLNNCVDYEFEVATLLTNRIIEQTGGYAYDYDHMGGGGAGAPNEGADDAGGGAGTPEYTGTNLQEAGVDEADILKTDGEHVYVQSGNDILILKTNPPEETELVGNLRLTGVNAELLLFEDQLVVISQNHAFNADDLSEGRCGFYVGDGKPEPAPDFDIGDYYCNTPDAVRIERWDVSDVGSPQHIQAIDLEGNFITVRAIDGELYLVHSFSPNIGWNFTSQIIQELELNKALGNRTGEARRSKAETMRQPIMAAVRQALQERPGALRPQHRINDRDAGTLGSCEQTFVPEVSASALSGIQLLQLTGLDLRDEDAAPNTVALLSDGWMTYASPSAIYIAQGSHNWAWRSNTARYETTDIHKFSLGGAQPSYAASGRVNGYVRDRFVMSERDEIFRIATTDRTNHWGIGIAIAGGDDVAVSPPVASEPATADGSGPGSPTGMVETVSSDDTPESDTPAPGNVSDGSAPRQQANNLYTLRQDGRNLVLHGSLEGFGATEQIYGTRYVGDMAYVVTFRQTDPLFSIDLSDQANPTIRGELKIPGFSNFLQSIGDGWLVGIGQEANEQGMIEGFQVQLFDVRDPDAPTRAYQHLVRMSEDGYHWSGSEAEYESRAFTWYPSRNLLSIPVYIQSMNDSFNGLIVFHITPEEGITEVGRIEHSELLQADCDADPSCVYDYHDYYTRMRRSAFIGDYLFALSSAYLSVSTIEDIPTPVYALEL